MQNEEFSPPWVPLRYNAQQVVATHCSNSTGGEGNDSTLIGDWELVPQDQKTTIVEQADDLLKVLQDLKISVGMKQKSNILVIQNVQIGSTTPDNLIADIVKLAAKNGGLLWLVNEIYKKACEMCGSQTEAAKLLGVSSRNVRKKIKCEDGDFIVKRETT